MGRQFEFDPVLWVGNNQTFRTTDLGYSLAQLLKFSLV